MLYDHFLSIHLSTWLWFVSLYPITWQYDILLQFELGPGTSLVRVEFPYYLLSVRSWKITKSLQKLSSVPWWALESVTHLFTLKNCGTCPSRETPWASLAGFLACVLPSLKLDRSIYDFLFNRIRQKWHVWFLRLSHKKTWSFVLSLLECFFWRKPAPCKMSRNLRLPCWRKSKWATWKAVCTKRWPASTRQGTRHINEEDLLYVRRL